MDHRGRQSESVSRAWVLLVLQGQASFLHIWARGYKASVSRNIDDSLGCQPEERQDREGQEDKHRTCSLQAGYRVSQSWQLQGRMILLSFLENREDLSFFQDRKLKHYTTLKPFYVSVLLNFTFSNYYKDKCNVLTTGRHCTKNPSSPTVIVCCLCNLEVKIVNFQYILNFLRILIMISFLRYKLLLSLQEGMYQFE